MTKHLILGIDGGQTATKAILINLDGTVLSTGRGPACDHIIGTNGRETNRLAIHTAALNALANANQAPENILAVGMGLTSAAREHRATPIFESIVREIANPDVIWVDADFVSNLSGASAGQPGIVVIAGGGSIGYGINANGEEAITAGLGYILGDEGSAWYIGLQAIIAATRANDGRGPKTDLLHFVRQTFQLNSVREIVKTIYAADFKRDTVSQLAPAIVEIAKTDAVAREIITTAASKLADIALATAHRIATPGDHIDVYPTGGVFSAGDPITTPFTQRISEAWPNSTIRQPQFHPEIGAALKAYTTLGHTISPAWLSRLKTTLNP